MKKALILAIAILAVAWSPMIVQAQDQATPPPSSNQRTATSISPYDVPPFSRMSFGAGLSPLGIGFQVSTDLNAHFNLRGVGNVFKYNTTYTTQGIPFQAGMTLGSGGIMLDVYPFHSGFRLSGGMLFVNDNGFSGTASIAGGNSITLDHQTYYSANSNPLTGTGSLGLNEDKPTAVVTTGWGNHVKRSGHLTFPVEIGAAFMGEPKINVQLTGSACTDQAQTQCTDISSSTNPIAQQFQSNLQAQIAKWNSNISGFSVYPIVSFGVAFSFQTRSY